MIVVTFAFSIIFALGWMLSQQATELAENLPRYQHALADKIGRLRKSAESSATFDKASSALTGLEKELADSAGTPDTGVAPSPTLGDKEPTRPIPVEIRESEPQPFEILQNVAGTVLPPLATAGIVVLFVIFILLQREDLRDRAIRLMGASDCSAPPLR